jgi:glucosamine--fructose-6-phosphate aminotransferase (isomerizing)
MATILEQEIYQQPDVIRNLVKTKRDQISELTDKLRNNPPRFILIAARGTSDNAAIYAKYLFSGINEIPVGLAMPSLYTLYKQMPNMEGGLVVGISQSGQTPDVRAVLEEAQRRGVPTISITNAQDGKTYTGQLTVVALLAAYLSGEKQLIKDIEQLAGFIEEALTQDPITQSVAGRFSKKNHIAIVGRGYNHCTTHEIALKIKELSYMIAQPYSAADFRHGPIALLESDFPVLAIAVNGKALPDMTSMIEAVKSTGADLAVMTNTNKLQEFTNSLIELPDDMPEWLSPIVTTVPGQLLALHLSLAKNVDPDKPRGLKKITLTY